MALLSGPGSERTFANRIGLDELSVAKAETTGEQIVTLGKRFASNVYLGVERGVTGAVSVVKVTYDLSRRWSVQARAGSENAVDLFYTLGFR
jgi:translocation and assembly module TamB